MNTVEAPTGFTEVGGIQYSDEELNQMLEYLDGLRESGVTNMYGASPYLQGAFGDLDVRQARDVLGFWMETFAERHEHD